MRWAGRTAAGLALLAAAAVGASPALADWGFLGGVQHSSVSPDAAFTPAASGHPQARWTFRVPQPTLTGQPSHMLFSTPAVYGGRVYVAANTGVLYAVDESTGTVLWSRLLGYVQKLTCAAKGFVSSPAVALDPQTGTPTVYAYSGNGTLYALNAADGTTRWSTSVFTPSSTENDYFAWSSPTISNGRVYVGVSSMCDHPLIRGGLRAYSQATGALLASYDSIPDGYVGGSVWSTPAVSGDGQSVFVTTGNPPETLPGEPGDTSSIVRLDSMSLKRLDGWKLPSAELAKNNDFGASPTLFSAVLHGHGGRRPTEMVGACNKDGTFYAFQAGNLSSGPVWKTMLGAKGTCLAAAVWDGTHLYLSGPRTSIGGVVYQGSVRSVDPATGHTIWETGLPGNVVGTPSMDSAGVLAAATDRLSGTGTDAAYLIDVSDGTVLATISNNNSPEFAQPVFSDGLLFLATQQAGLHVYAPS